MRIAIEELDESVLNRLISKILIPEIARSKRWTARKNFAPIQEVRLSLNCL